MALWVSITELQAYLIAAALLKNPVGEHDPTGFLPLSDALRASQDEFERRVGWNPFVWSGGVETRYFNADGQPVLDLKAGILRVEGVTVAGTDWTVGLTPYISGMNVFPETVNTVGNDYPYTRLRFAYSGYPYQSVAGTNAVAVTGDWGRVYSLPFDVKLGVLGYAAAQLLPVFTAARTGGAIRVKEADEEVQFNTSPFGEVGASLTGQFERAVSHWKRLRIG
jgi:hypothetical protein